MSEETKSDDILDLLESEEKPFVEKVSENKTYGDKKDWKEKKNYTPREIKPTDLNRDSKTFAIALQNPTTELDEKIQEKILMLTKALVTKHYKFRTMGDKNHQFIKTIIENYPASLEIFFPWKTFNSAINANLVKPDQKAFEMVAKYHKGWEKLPNSIRSILAANMHTMLGKDLNTPIKFLIVYTEDGVETAKKINFKTTGSASFNITIAEVIGVPVFNLKNEDAVKRLIEYVKALES